MAGDRLETQDVNRAWLSEEENLIAEGRGRKRTRTLEPKGAAPKFRERVKEWATQRCWFLRVDIRWPGIRGAIMADPGALKYVFYIAATPEKVWDGFVSRESNQIIFLGAEFQADFTPGGALAWVGPMASP
jgi:hypothetical protein